MKWGDCVTIKMIASDMDGTFLNDKGSYDREKFLTILDRLDQEGIHFVVASGNNMERLNLIFKGLTDRMSFVAENGAHIVEEGRTLKRHILNKKDVALFLEYFADKMIPYGIILSGQYCSYMHKDAKLPEGFAIEPDQLEQFFANIERIEDFSSISDQDIFKITMMVPMDECDQEMIDFNNDFKGNLTATTSGFGSVDIIQTGIHKAWGLQLLMDTYDVTEDQLMAFGDGGNDIEMLQLAGYSYAMENAPAIVKKAAKFIAPHHKEEGVLQVLEAFLAKESPEMDGQD